MRIRRPILPPGGTRFFPENHDSRSISVRKLSSVGLAVIATLLLGVTSVLADSPHFLYANASIDSGGALTVAFKDAGLGTGVSSIAVTLDANATAEYQCWNNGGKHPRAGNKESVEGPLSNTDDFAVRHGQVTASLTVGPPSQGSFSCPSGQTLYLMSVTYSDIVVSDATGNSLGATPDPISTGPIMIKV
jgi:hypothetical protein